MPKISMDTAQVERHGPVEHAEAMLDGYTVNFMTAHDDVDVAPLLRGLPDDRCHCPHWGYVIAGRITFRFADHDEVVEAGDAFYLPPGHAPIVEAGTQYVQFSPAETLAEVDAVIRRNLAEMMAG